MKPKMKKSVKSRWLKALRSGEYKQGHEQLCYVDENGSRKFCCLGVLCDLHSKSTHRKWQKMKCDSDPLLHDHPDTLVYGREREFASLPREVVRWAGISAVEHDEDSSDDPSLGNSGYSLSQLNDGCRINGELRSLSFRQIARLIEHHL